MKQQPFDPGITQSYGGRLRRIVNKDGSFNVHRHGTRLRDFHVYKFLIGLSWPWFVAAVLATFLVVSVVFAGLYLAIGAQGEFGGRDPGQVPAGLEPEGGDLPAGGQN